MTNIHYKNKIFKIEDCFEQANTVNCNYFKSVATLIDSWIKNKNNFEIMTSGSTGKPKPIVFTREQCIISARQTIDIFGLQKGDNFLCCLDINYVAGFMMIIRAMVAEANICLTKAERNPLRKTDKKVEFDFAAFVPYQLQSILEDDLKNISKLDSMKVIIIGGGAISEKNLETFCKIKAPIYHTYGMTETLTHVALKRINGNKPDKTFKAIPGVIFSTDARECLTMKTPVLKGEIVTNDLVNLISANEFDYLGRIDNVINSGGFKIHPQMVEQKIEILISELFNTSNYFIFAAKHPKFEQHPELIIEAKFDQAKLTLLNNGLKKILHPYEIPKQIHFSNQFIYTRTGKVDRGKTISKSTF